ncbi:MAG: ATP-dependent RecD-like DNA helicase, partial [Firmicutes bacterium]|nr:ATP-dependent RecD-like DNA helicase [Bacillota bacterium]
MSFVICHLSSAMKLEGTIEDIIFRNEENGYTVFILGSGLREITAVGFFPSFHAGAGLSLEGEYENTKYGLQFTVKSYEYTVPSTTAGMVKFLSSGLVKGIGPVTAGEIVKKFGDASFAVMRDAPERLASVRGISRKKALAIGAEYVRVFEMQETVMSLQKLDITLNLCTKIYKIYGKQSGDTVLKNPYKLVEDIEGVGFLTADKIARKAGIPPLSVFRIRAACLHALNENAEKSGNTYLPRGALASAVATLLGAELKPDEFYSLLEEWTLDGALKTVPGTDGEPRVFIKKLYQTEKNIAASLVKLKNAAPTVPDDFTDRIAEFERVNAVEFHESQIAAIQSALSSGVSVITGGPGTGKTTIIRCILHILKGGGKKVLLAAPTGRAAKRMQEAAKEEAMTLHRALGAEFAGGRSRFAYNEHNRLPYECVIVDEVSMIDCYLMNSLLKALSPGTRLLMVGDKD